MKFKVGDRVRRIKGSSQGCVQMGSEYTVTAYYDNAGELELHDIPSRWNEENFELVEPIDDRPWLKIIPPVPEKRELRSFGYRTIYSLTFSSDNTFAYVAWGDLLRRSIAQSFTKDELRRFGETLVKISEDMK